MFSKGHIFELDSKDRIYLFSFLSTGFLMVLDVFQERGLPFADDKFSDPNLCFFPLFNFITPLPVDWMYLVYLILLIGKYEQVYLTCCHNNQKCIQIYFMSP